MGKVLVCELLKGNAYQFPSFPPQCVSQHLVGGLLAGGRERKSEQIYRRTYKSAKRFGAMCELAGGIPNCSW